MKIAIVILNWNGAELLKTYLPFVLTHSEGAEVWVIDNASTDNSLAVLQNNFPGIKTIRLDKNYGFTGGYNKGLAQIEADVFCLLNSDVEVTKNWLEPITETFKKRSDVAIVQPKILDLKQRDTFEYAGAAGGFSGCLRGW